MVQHRPESRSTGQGRPRASVVRDDPPFRRWQRPDCPSGRGYGTGSRRSIAATVLQPSVQIQRERTDYYDMLERTQKGSLDVTDWLEWLLGCLLRAMQGAEVTLSAVMVKANFWQRWAGTPMNEQ